MTVPEAVQLVLPREHAVQPVRMHLDAWFFATLAVVEPRVPFTDFRALDL